MEEFDEDIKNACRVLNGGGLILYPTDTVWGIGCDATDEGAVRRVYDLKKRADCRAMLVLLDSPAKVERYVREMPDIARDLIELADKPLTVVYSGCRNLAANLSGEDGSIGIRVTGEDFSRELCRAFRKPLVSTSANISGQPAPSSFGDIADEIRRGVDYIVRYRREDKTEHKPSTIIRLGSDNSIRIIRK
ncbi:MAG: threonylcarbamoyl-AMP synthase [Tannerella sp.]|jgi:L-threonylcarbamoyladenylate synthase|nr:threonylcarbamoyl-AMP synthase [Tannerella sp.]